MPFTIDKYIILPKNTLEDLLQSYKHGHFKTDFIDTLIHEKTHVIQRFNQSRFDTFYKTYYKHIVVRKFNDVIPDVLDKNHMANPDSNNSIWLYKLKNHTYIPMLVYSDNKIKSFAFNIEDYNDVIDLKIKLNMILDTDTIFLFIILMRFSHVNSRVMYYLICHRIYVIDLLIVYKYLKKTIYIYNKMELANDSKNSDDIYISFNQTEKYACFGTSIGFYIYSLNPFKKILSRKIDLGISIVKMLYESNIIVFVGRSDSGLYPNNKLIIWDDSKKAVLGEISYSSKINNVNLTKDYIVVLLEKKIYIYKFGLELIKALR